MSDSNLVYQFRITLCGISPLIWRTIQVPKIYSFWDLHVAIQDSMGWLDYHLHAFSFPDLKKRKSVEIGIPVEDIDDSIVLPGWDIKIKDYFTEPGKVALYEYDFGDTWKHELLFEGILLKEKNIKYPRCINGERACPPEDCGGVFGYYQLLEVLSNPKHSEYRQTNEWLKGHAKNYW